MKAYFLHYQQEIFENQMAVFIILPLVFLSFFGIFYGFSLPIFLFAGSIGFLLSLWSPRSGIFSVVFLTTIFTFSFSLLSFQWGMDSYKLYPIDMLLGAVFVATLFRLVLRQDIFPWRKNIDGWLVAFFIWMTVVFFITVIHSTAGVNFDTAFSTWKNYVFYGLLYFCIPILFSTRERLEQLAQVFLIACILSIAFLLIGIINGQGLWVEYTPLSTEGIRYLDFSHAFYFSMAILVVVFSWRENPTNIWWRYSRFFILFLWCVGVIVSLMRHMWVGLVIVPFVMFFVIDRGKKRVFLRLVRKFVFIGIGVTFLGIYGAVILQNHHLQSEISQLTQSFVQRAASLGNSNDESISWRNAAWQGAWKVFSSDPIIGTGFGVRVPIEMDNYQDFVEIRNIHNSWLALLIQTGYIGLGLFLASIVSLAIRVLRRMRKSQNDAFVGIGIATLGLFIFHLVSFPIQPYLEANFTNIFFWINLGVMRSYLNLYTKNR